jgi:hypothetical protein
LKEGLSKDFEKNAYVSCRKSFTLYMFDIIIEQNLEHFQKEKDMYIGDVRTRDEAQMVIAQLLEQFSGDTAFSRIREDAQFAKQTTEETAYRTAGNLLNSFVVRKPNGTVNPVW